MAIPPKASKIAAAIVVVIGAACATVWAQSQGQSQALGPSSGGSLAELTAEVRQLRVSIEGAGRTQMQVSALGMALTTQQVRMSQLAARVDKADDELSAASAKAQNAASQMERLLKAQGRTTTPEERRSWEEEIRRLKAIAGEFADDENRLRTRQQELMATYRGEEDRWRDLVARLEEIIKK
jgi:predicted  nucleic acid-binding Zn-ribbon protein